MQRFQYPRFFKWLALFGIVLFGSMAAVSVVVAVYDQKNFASLILLSMSAAFLIFIGTCCYEFFRRANDVFSINESGLSLQSNRGSCFIPWSGIGRIKSRELLQRVELYSQAGQRILTLDYQLNGFDHLRNVILAKIGQSDPDQKKEFTSSWYLRGAFVVSMAVSSLAAIGSGVSGQKGPMVGFIGFVVFGLFGYLWEVKRIIIGQDEVQIRSALKSKTIAFSDISDIDLQNEKDGKGNLVATVFIRRGNEKPIKLAGIMGGPIPLYNSLHKEWSRYQLERSKFQQ